MCMTYRGNSEQDALKNLTRNIRERLAKAGLSSVSFEAVAQDKKYGGMILNIGGDWGKGWDIINEEISKFRKERYMIG